MFPHPHRREYSSFAYIVAKKTFFMSKAHAKANRLEMSLA